MLLVLREGAPRPNCAVFAPDGLDRLREQLSTEDSRREVPPGTGDVVRLIDQQDVFAVNP